MAAPERKTVRQMRMEDHTERLNTMVFTALGQASMCWGNLREAGIFQDGEAALIGETLVKHLRNQILEAYGQGFLDAAKEAEQQYADQHADKQPGVPQNGEAAETNGPGPNEDEPKAPMGSGDVVAWARFWDQMIARHPGIPTDEGAMISWFANVVQDCIDAANRQAKAVADAEASEEPDPAVLDHDVMRGSEEQNRDANGWNIDHRHVGDSQGFSIHLDRQDVGAARSLNVTLVLP